MVVILGAAIATGFALGCGDGEDEAGAAPLTKAEFIEQAEAICAKSLKEREEDTVSWEKENSGKGNGGTPLTDVVAPSLAQEAEELKTLVPPAEDEADVTRMIGRLSEVSEAFEEGDSKKAPRAIEQFNRESADYGLSGCP